jgi:hypothetical protein
VCAVAALSPVTRTAARSSPRKGNRKQQLNVGKFCLAIVDNIIDIDGKFLDCVVKGSKIASSTTFITIY